MQDRWFGAIACLGLLLFRAETTQAAVIHVPGDRPTIQAGIDAAQDGDTVLVDPGTYTENINFSGKAILVASSGGAPVTIIDGGHTGPTVTFSSGETRSSVLRGFGIQNGMSDLDGGGVSIDNASPVVWGNVFAFNVACSGGGAIGVQGGSPLIVLNVIAENFQSGCTGGIGGGGISIAGAGSAEITANFIAGNTSGNGGGIALFAAGTPTIRSNIILLNTADSAGGGIWMANDSAAIVAQNLVHWNTAQRGAGVFFTVPSGGLGPTLVNNTIVDNDATAQQGSAVWAGGFADPAQLLNNLLIGPSGQSAVFCDATLSPLSPRFTANDAFSFSAPGLQGSCASQSGQNGNISVPPLFVNRAQGNYHLRADSPAIDTGTNAAPHLTSRDLDGNPRIVDGDADGDSIVDMGAYEFQP